MDRLLPLLPLLALCGGCSPGAEVVSPGEDPALDLDAELPADALKASELLPLRAGQVYWYRATIRSDHDAGSVDREVALFTARDPDAGLYLESIGLGDGDSRSSMRIYSRKGVLYVFPGGLSEPGYQLSLRGRGRDLRTIETPAGSFRALVLRHEAKGFEVLHCLAPKTGLVEFALRANGEELLKLELVEELARGRPAAGYHCDTPQGFWRAYELALRHLDVDALAGFLTPELGSRLRWPIGSAKGEPDAPLLDARSKAHADLSGSSVQLERVRAVISELLDVRLRPTGPWVVERGDAVDTATAEGLLVAWLEGASRVSPAEIVLERRHDGPWRLADFR